MQKTILIVLAVLLGIGMLVAIPFGMYVGFHNNIKATGNEIEAQLKQVDNILLRRHDLIPNLVNTVKGYAAHETDIFTNLNNARNRMLEANTLQERSAANNALDSALNRLMMVVENYPQLKANEQFNRLMDALEGTENRLAVERKRYNDLVRTYNTKIDMFPGSIFAGLMGLSKKEYFEISESARENPIVNF